MKDFSAANFEFLKEFCSIPPFPVSHIVTSTMQRERCQNCGRDLSQPNLLPPSNSKSDKNFQGVSRGHDICSQCGGLGAGLLDEISRY
jgi:rRNA maturation protein Nop10